MTYDHPKSIFQLRFAPGFVQPMSLCVSILIFIHHYIIEYGMFFFYEILCCLHWLYPNSMKTIVILLNLQFGISWSDLYLEAHSIHISDWIISLNINEKLSFLQVFFRHLWMYVYAKIYVCVHVQGLIVCVFVCVFVCMWVKVVKLTLQFSGAFHHNFERQSL